MALAVEVLGRDKVAWLESLKPQVRLPGCQARAVAPRRRNAGAAAAIRQARASQCVVRVGVWSVGCPGVDNSAFLRAWCGPQAYAAAGAGAGAAAARESPSVSVPPPASLALTSAAAGHLQPSPPSWCAAPGGVLPRSIGRAPAVELYLRTHT